MDRLYFETKDGNIIKNKNHFWEMLNQTGCWIIEKHIEKRSIDQNRYLRGGVYATIAKETGNDEEYIHGICGMKFLLDNTRKLPYVKSTATLSTKEFREYIEKIKNWMAEFDIHIPSTEEYKKYFIS